VILLDCDVCFLEELFTLSVKLLGHKDDIEMLKLVSHKECIHTFPTCHSLFIYKKRCCLPVGQFKNFGESYWKKHAWIIIVTLVISELMVISLSPVISGPGHLICCTALFTCGPCDNFCYLGHTKKSWWWWWWMVDIKRLVLHWMFQFTAGGRYLVSSDIGCMSSERTATTADNSSHASVT